jgi:hypothetical protein
VALLLSVERGACPGDVGAPPRHNECRGHWFELHGQQLPRKIEFLRGLHQPPTRLYFVTQVGAVPLV